MNSMQEKAGHFGLQPKLLQLLAKIQNDIDFFQDDPSTKDKSQQKEQNVSMEDLVDSLTKKIRELHDVTHKKMKNLMELNSMGEVSLLDYNNLEKALQKNESEIRNHIRTEQQLKFCAESIQAKLEEIEKEKQQLFEENQKNSQIYKKEVDSYKLKYESAIEEIKKMKNSNKNDLKTKTSQDFDLKNIEKLKDLECFYNEIKHNQRKALSLIDPNLLKKLQNFEDSDSKKFEIPPLTKRPPISNKLLLSQGRLKTKSIHVFTSKQAENNENRIKKEDLYLLSKVHSSQREENNFPIKQDLSNNMMNNNNSFLISLGEEGKIEGKHRSNKSMMNSTGYIYKIKPSSINKSKPN